MSKQHSYRQNNNNDTYIDQNHQPPQDIVSLNGLCPGQTCDANTLLASQSGAHRRGAFRDFHPIQPSPTFEHLSLYTEAFQRSKSFDGDKNIYKHIYIKTDKTDKTNRNR